MPGEGKESYSASGAASRNPTTEQASGEWKPRVAWEGRGRDSGREGERERDGEEGLQERGRELEKGGKRH